MKVYDSYPMQLNKNNLAAFEFDVAEPDKHGSSFLRVAVFLHAFSVHTRAPKPGLVLA